MKQVQYLWLYVIAVLFLIPVNACRHAGYTITVNKIEEKSDTPPYTISAALPQLSKLSDSSAQNKINALLAYYIQSQVTQFKEDIKVSERSSGGNTWGSRTEKPAGELSIETTTGLNQQKLVSVKVATLYNNTEAAYPQYMERCFTFDTNNGELLTLDRLFTPESNYLQAISAYVAPRLVSQQQAEGYEVNTELIQKATAPLSSNFTTFLLYPDRISFFFPYYSISSQHQPDVWMDVPTSVLEKYMLKEYRW